MSVPPVWFVESGLCTGAIQGAIPFSQEGAFDAAVSARVMAEHAAELAALTFATDPRTALEGEIWVPNPG